ncbi:MAG: hypothetical protein H3C41_10390 [Bacteroidales bacterium]|nr:hypothetical protein [Bacteroidales bacterium]
MKKKFFLVTAFSLLTLSGGSLLAQNTTNPKPVTPAPFQRGQFVDANKDGVCDNWAQRGQGRGGQGQFVDENKNGICDFYESRSNGNNPQFGRGRGAGRGMGPCNTMGRGRQGFGRGWQGRGMGRGMGWQQPAAAPTDTTPSKAQ